LQLPAKWKPKRDGQNDFRYRLPGVPELAPGVRRREEAECLHWGGASYARLWSTFQFPPTYRKCNVPLPFSYCFAEFLYAFSRVDQIESDIMLVENFH
jgi:hypothetical protein